MPLIETPEDVDLESPRNAQTINLTGNNSNSISSGIALGPEAYRDEDQAYDEGRQTADWSMVDAQQREKSL